MTANATTENLIKLYAQYLSSLNRARKTVLAQVMQVTDFFTFAEERGVTSPAEVSKPLILDYQKYLFERLNMRGVLNTPCTRNKYLTAVVGFFEYLQGAGYIAHNPTIGIEYAKVPKRLPKAVLTHGEMKKLLAQPDTSTVLGYRDRTILELMYTTALRRNEVLNLDLEHLDLETGFLMVRQGKGMKDRVVPVGKVACKYLETYINGIRPELLKHCSESKTPALFPSARTGRLCRNALASIIDKYARRAGLAQHVTPHTFRHTCATQLIRHNAGIRHVQEILGHSSLTSTQEYIRLTMTDLKQAHSKFHPREKDR